MTTTNNTRVIGWFVALWLVSVAYCYCGDSHAYAMPAAANAALAETLARVAVHEGALQSERDTLLVWQCTQTNASTPARQHAWLLAHSPRATGVIPARLADANAWTADYDFVTVPEAFPQPGFFRTVTLPKARRIYELALRLVSGEAYDKPCDVPPRTWDGRKFKHTYAASVGLIALDCKGTINDGFAYRSDIVAVRGTK